MYKAGRAKKRVIRISTTCWPAWRVSKQENSGQNGIVKIIMTHETDSSLNNNLKFKKIFTPLFPCHLTVHSRFPSPSVLLVLLQTWCVQIQWRTAEVWCVHRWKCILVCQTPQDVTQGAWSLEVRTGKVDRCVELQLFPYVDFCL